jgi:hypothetical protein
MSLRLTRKELKKKVRSVVNKLGP